MQITSQLDLEELSAFGDMSIKASIRETTTLDSRE
jgi:hypothetical protein